MPVAVKMADNPGDKDRQDERKHDVEDVGLQRAEVLHHVLMIAQRRIDPLEEIRIVQRDLGQLPAHARKTQERQNRNQDRRPEEKRHPFPVPSFQTQPEMQAHADMAPDDDHHEGLLHTPDRIGHPYGRDDIFIGRIEIQQRTDDGGADHMHQNQRKDQKAQPNLHPFPQRHAEG